MNHSIRARIIIKKILNNMVFFQNLIRGILRKRRLRMTILLILYNFNEYLIYFFFIGFKVHFHYLIYAVIFV